MARNTEPSANDALAWLLKGMMHGCDVRSENTRVIDGKPGLQPDIVVTAGDRAPVVIEAEFMPARTVEEEARDRLGLRLAGGSNLAGAGKKIEAVIALRYPEDTAEADNLGEAVAGVRLSYCALTDDGEEGIERFPQSGWLEGSVADVAELARLLSVPQSAVNAAAAAFERGIDSGAALLKTVAETRPGITRAIADRLGMSDVPQTHRMACAIVANAMVFHDRVAGMHPGIKPLRLVCGQGVANPQANIVQAWKDILAINYWPIFAIARKIIEQMPTREGTQLIRLLQYAAGEVASSGMNVEHDLTGRVFQRLIADRKYLATFYTLPASAALLARLAVEKLQGVDWSDADAIGRLRVGDFACGTGALLSAVYEQIATRHEQTGGNPSALHRAMMEDVLYGCDVMPSALHITSSTLSGREPKVSYDKSRLYGMPYGRQQDGTVAIGSLELLQSSAVQPLFNMSDPAMRTGSAGEETAERVQADIPDEGFDIVIMNPPFTRATNHGGAHANVVNPAFAAFDASKADMDAMGKQMRERGKGTCYDGKAGLASAFAALADLKLKPGGVFAFVLPLSCSVGASWQKFRKMLMTDYTDLQVVSIAANRRDVSFSADTGMAECLVVARKLRRGETSSDAMSFISMNGRPGGFVQAAEIAKEVIDVIGVRSIEDGPYGGTKISVGEEQIGEKMSAKIS